MAHSTGGTTTVYVSSFVHVGVFVGNSLYDGAILYVNPSFSSCWLVSTTSISDPLLVYNDSCYCIASSLILSLSLCTERRGREGHN